MSIKIETGDIFDLAPKGAYLLHACNCQGVWGSGIARQFRDKYPRDYLEYMEYCDKGIEPGSTFITKNRIICLFTSDGYGKNVSSKEVILYNTDKCLHELETMLKLNSVIYSPKINSGLFETPWKDTKKLINDFLERRPDVTWVVGELE